MAFGKRCGEAGVRPSMGSVGDAYDNAMAESFFSTLEAELGHVRQGGAYSGDCDRPFRSKVITDSADRDHAVTRPTGSA